MMTLSFRCNNLLSGTVDGRNPKQPPEMYKTLCIYIYLDNVIFTISTGDRRISEPSTVWPSKYQPFSVSTSNFSSLRLESRGAAVQQQMWAAKQVDRWCQQRLRETLVSSTVQMDRMGGEMPCGDFWCDGSLEVIYLPDNQ